jgi:hypothetical protein
MEFAPFLNDPSDKLKLSRAKSMSVLGQVIRNSLSNRVLLDLNGAFEDLVGKIAAVVYRDYPGKFPVNVFRRDRAKLELGTIFLIAIRICEKFQTLSSNLDARL